MKKPKSDLSPHIYYQAIFNAASNGMALTYAETDRIIDVNVAWTRITGIARADALGKTVGELGIWVPTDEHETCIAALKRCEQVLDYEVQLITRNGIVH